MALLRLLLRVFNYNLFRVCHKRANVSRVLGPCAVLALLCAILMFSSAALAQQGTFVPTGSMNHSRSAQTATLLNNGKVLVAGGDSGGVTAELYDPATETFTLTGSMNTPRSSQTATLLKNGMVLVAGGDSGGVTAELYDPTTGTFAPTGSMNTARNPIFTATLLNNGKVLVAGGGGPSAELYDPAAGTFTPTGSLKTGRVGHTATLLNNGKVLVAGGDVATAELYDPVTGTFTLTGSLNQTPLNGTATLLKNGMVLVAGGGGPSAELYNPATGTFSVTGSMSYSRSLFTSTLLNNGMVLVVGAAPAELYDPATGTFTLLPLLPANLSTVSDYETATLLNTGMVLVAGGGSASSELYEQVVVSPPSLSFSNQPTATTSASQTVTLTNNESTALTIKSVSINGANASDFAETDNCVGNLSVGASCSINVTFTPAATGRRSASLAISNNLSASPVPVPLDGAGVPPPLVSVTPSNISFPSQYVGTSGLPQNVTVTNNGVTPLNITGVTTSPSEFATLSACGSSLAAGASCAIGVFFDPTASGTRAGTMTINDDGVGSPHTVALSGTGQDFSMTSPAPMASVAAGQTATYSVSVSPGGGFNQTVSFSCAGAPSLSTCTVSPSSATLNGTSATSLMITVSTTAAAIVFPNCPKSGPRYPVNYRLLVLVWALSALALMVSLVKGTHTRHSLATVSLLSLTICIGFALAACGGGGSSKPGTPAGAYSLTVTGTFNSGTTTLAHNTKLNLVVQ